MGALDEYIQTEYVTKKIEESGDTHFTCLDAEENILRRMLKSNDVAADVCESMTGKDFSNVDYGRLFNAIQDVVRRDMQVDAITVEAAAGRMFPKNAKRLREIVVVLTKYREPTVDDTHNIADHVAIVRSLAMRRAATRNMGELMNRLYDPSKNIAETLLAIREAVDTSGVDTGKSMTLQNVLLNTFDYAERLQKGKIKAIKTGLKNLDNLISGFYGGELTVIGARPSVGKSAFAQFIALSAAKSGHKVGFVSCEMSDIGFGQRIFAYLGAMDGMNIRRGDVSDDDWSRMAMALQESNELSMEFKFDTTFVEDVVQWATRKARRGELDILFVDYLQLMDTRKKFDSEHLRVGYISRTLKKLAQQLNIPVVAAAQVNRETDGSMPTMKYLKDSGSIEQDCDGVIFLHRPKDASDASVDERDRPYFDSLREKGFTYLCVGVAKQRNGSIGKISVLFRPQYTEFTALTTSGET